MKQVIIIGAGIVGWALAEKLSLENHQVAVIERDRSIVREMEEKLDVLAICGNACTPSVLRKAGIEHADLFIAVTDVDEVNLVAAMIAAHHPQPYTVARLRNTDFTTNPDIFPLEKLGIDHVINPEPSIVESLEMMVELPGCREVALMGDGQTQVLGFKLDPDSNIAGMSVAGMRELNDLDGLLVLYLIRNGEIIIPHGGMVLQGGDELHLLIDRYMASIIMPLMSTYEGRVEHVIIHGASRLGLELARKLENTVRRVFLIERDADRAVEAATQLNKAIVLNGDGTDLETLEEAAIDCCDLFCALSDSDQDNMLSALLAKRQSDTRAAVIVHHPEYTPVLEGLGVESVISPRKVTVEEILKHVRRGTVHSVTSVSGNKGEIIEFEAEEGSAVTKSPLRELHFPKDSIVGGVVDKGDIMYIADGGTHIRAGQRVFVFAMSEVIRKVEAFFTVSGGRS